MKKIPFLFALFFLALSVSVNGQSAPSPVDKVIKFSKDKYDLGKLTYRKTINFDMEFTNISKKPVVVENVMAGCGCTVPEKPQQPIAPGKTGKIKVQYDATAAPGSSFSRDVTVKIAGVTEPKTMIFVGEIAQ